MTTCPFSVQWLRCVSSLVTGLMLTISAALAQPQAPAQPTLRQLLVQNIHFTLVSFDQRHHRLVVLDQPAGPGSRWPNAQAAALAQHALAVINAGFFTPQGEPLGRLIASGQARGSDNPSSLGSAVWYESRQTCAIVRRSRAPMRAKELLQAGPLLIEKGQIVSGLNAERRSARCFIAWNGKEQWSIARTSPCTLRELAQSLNTGKVSPFPIHMAMNLDGGRSAEMYVGHPIPGGPVFERPLWNTTVRNYLALLPR